MRRVVNKSFGEGNAFCKKVWFDRKVIIRYVLNTYAYSDQITCTLRLMMWGLRSTASCFRFGSDARKSIDIVWCKHRGNIFGRKCWKYSLKWFFGEHCRRLWLPKHLERPLYISSKLDWPVHAIRKLPATRENKTITHHITYNVTSKPIITT